MQRENTRKSSTFHASSFKNYKNDERKLSIYSQPQTSGGETNFFDCRDQSDPSDGRTSQNSNSSLRLKIQVKEYEF